MEKNSAKSTTSLLSIGQSIFIGLSLVFAIFTLGRIIWKFELFDFNIYYQASSDLLAGKPLYRNPAIDNNYPPSAFLFTIPFVILPIHTAGQIWTVCSIFFLFGSITALLLAINRFSTQIVMLIFAIAIWSFPVKFSFGLGQINFLILFFYSLCFYFTVKNRPALAGIFLALAAAIKLTPLLLLFFFWRKKLWKSALFLVATFLGMQFLALLMFGYENTHSFFAEVLPHIPTVGNASYFNQAVTGLLARNGIVDITAMIGNYGLLLFLSSLLWGYTSQKNIERPVQLMEFGGFVLISLLSAGLAWQHHFVWVLLPLLGMWFENKSKTKLQVTAIAICMMLMAINFKNPNAMPTWATLFLSHVTVGAGGLLYLILTRLQTKQVKSL